MIELKDIQGRVIYSTEINNGAKRKFQLMKEDYITLPFSLEKPIKFGVGCNTEVNGELFEVTELQKPTYNNTTGGYDYQLRLDAYYWKWKNKSFKFTPEVGGQEASWSLTASLDVHLGIFLRNLKALGYTYRGSEFEFSIDATVENKAISMSYENTNMIDALSAMAENWQCEWWLTDNTIHFGRCEYGNPIDFELGVNVDEMKASASQSPYATRLYVFGSTRNLPANYRPTDESLLVNGVVQKRLMLPEGTPYLDAYAGMKEEEAIEEVVILEDVYPKTDGKIASVVTYEDSVENEDGTTITETFYRFTDDGINFSKDYILEGQELKVKFTSGLLNGMEFGLAFNPNEVAEKLEDGEWNPEAQLYEVVVNEDYGRKLPDDTLNPKVGDSYILLGWDSTKIADLGLVSKAETELLSEGQKILEKRKVDPSTYSCRMFSDYMYENHLFEVGDRVNLINETYFENGRQSRIIGFEYNLDFPFDNPIFIVGETASYSRLGELENKLDALTYKGQTYTSSGGGSSVYIIGTTDTTKPSNKNVFSAARTERDFITKVKDDKTPFNFGIGKSLSVGEDLEVKGSASIGGEIKSDDFVAGDLMGSGWSIYRDSNGNTVVETDRIVVRQSLEATELVVNQETFEKGSNIFVKGGCTITKVEIANGRYRCYYNNEEGRRFSGFKVGDQARCQRYNASYGGVIKYYWRLVTGVEEDYVELSMTDCDGTGIPEEGDDIAQLGSRYDKTRQSAIVISPDNGGSVIIWAGIDSFDLSEKNMVGMGVNPNTGRAYLYGYGDMFFGDRSLEKNYITYQTRDGETEPTLNINADIHFGKGSDGLSNLSEFKDIQNDVDNLFGQIEREFTIWYYDYEPTLDNEPAVNWVSDSDKALHDQDIFFSDKLARAWRFVNGAWVEITDERTLSALKLAEDAHAAAAEAEKNAKEAKEYIDNILPSKLEELQNQIDGAIESFFYKYDPTTSNEPASLWITEEQKAMHLNDTFTNLESGYSWRWTKNGSVYGWTEISDTATVKALVAAGQAQDTADQKRRVFVATPYAPYDEGDLWVQGETGDIMRCSKSRASGNFVSSDWVKASKYTDNSALEAFIQGDYKNQLASIQSQMDKRAETWCQVEDPSLAWTTQELKQLHAGDLWYNINKGLSYMWSGTEWVVQGVPDEVFDTIDGKASIYTSQPSSYKKNDLWILASDTTLDKAYKSGTIVVAKQDSDTFVASHWTKKDRYTDDSALETFLNGAYKTQIDEIKGQIDKKSETWYQNTDPSLNWDTTQKNEHKGDLWYNTNEDQTYIWSGTIWIPQGVPDEVFDKIDGKAQIFASRPNSYNKNDLWVLEQNMKLDKDYKKGTIVIAATSSNYFVAAHWTKLDRYTDDSRADEAYGKAEEAYRKAESFSEDLSGVISDMDIVMNQVDREFTIWYYNHVPTLNNAPAVDWDTDEEKQRHDQDICFADELARAWRFVNGQWVEITDERTLAALKISEDAKADAEDAKKDAEEAKEQATAAANRVANVEYLKDTFGKNETIVDGGVYISKLVSVKNEEENIEAFLNGSDVGKDAEHGKLILAGGIPESGGNLEERSRNALTRIYEDGTLISDNVKVKGEIHATSGTFDNVHINGTIRTRWELLKYKVLYYTSSSIEQWGFDGSAIYNDKIILVGGIGTPELLMAWGDDADGRELAICNRCVRSVSGTYFGVAVKVKVPTGKYIVGLDGTKVSGGNEFNIDGKKIYYMVGFNEGWYVTNILNLND